MKNKKVILIKEKDPMIVKMLSAAFNSNEYNVIFSNCSYENFGSEIKKEKPDIVLIWSIDDTDEIPGYIRGWEYADSRPFFIVTTCYRDVFTLLDEHLPGNAYPVLEPVSTGFLKDIIQKAAEGRLCFDIL